MQISLEQLEALLAESVAMETEPELMFESEIDASYETLAQVLRLIMDSGATKFGFVGNEKLPENETD